MTAESTTIAELTKAREEIRRMEIERESLITAASYWSKLARKLANDELAEVISKQSAVLQAQSDRLAEITAERDQLERTVERLQSVIANGVV